MDSSIPYKGASGSALDGSDSTQLQPSRLLRGANVLSLIGALAANGIVSNKIGLISAKYNNDIVPDGWAFSIWGIIYTLLGVWACYQAIMWTDGAATYVVRIGGLFIGSCFMNALWVVTFVQGTAAATVVSSVFLFVLLGLLVAIYLKLDLWNESRSSSWDYALLEVPFSIYCSWCTVACVVNVSAAGVACGWTSAPFDSGSTWSAIMLCIAAVINLAVLGTRKDPVFPLVFVWAALAIHTGHADDKLVSTLAMALALLVLGADMLACGYLTVRGSWCGGEVLRGPEDK